MAEDLQRQIELLTSSTQAVVDALGAKVDALEAKLNQQAELLLDLVKMVSALYDQQDDSVD